MLFSMRTYLRVGDNNDNSYPHEQTADFEGMCLHTEDSYLYLLFCAVRSARFHRRR